MGGTATRDTTQFHSGAASDKLGLAVNQFQATSHSDCANASAAAGSVPVSYWYRTTSAINGLAMTVNAYGSPGCSSGIVQTSFSPGSINTSGTWQHVTGNLTLPSAAQSFKVTLAMGCSAGCSGAVSVNFDDVSVDQSPTAVTLVSFRGSRTAHGVRLTWRTATATQVVGFNVYRGQHKLNSTLVASRGSLGVAVYALLDRTAGRGSGAVTYTLQAVRLNGARAWIGATTVR